MLRTGIKNTMFIKLILFFFVVLVISFCAVLIYSNEYLNQKALTSIETASIQALGSVESYVNEKHNTAKRMIASLYNSSFYNTIPSNMPNISTKNYDSKLVFNATVDEYLQFGFASDNDITNIGLQNYSDGSIIYRKKGASHINKLERLERSLREQIDIYSVSLSSYGFNIFPAYINDNIPYSGYLIPMLCHVKSVDMRSDIGCLLIDYSSNNMMSLLDSYMSNFPSSIIYIVNESGTVIFDSAFTLIGQSYPDMEYLQATDNISGIVTDHDLFINSSYSSKLKLYFITTTIIDDIYGPLSSQKGIIRLGIAALSLLCLLSCVLFAWRYFRRINILCDAIKEIRSGNLQVRVPKGNYNDELSLISENLNEMCHKLEDYIQKVYITQIEAQGSKILRKDAQLKQRTAELYALQTQINPHFLYNTLESIRMRALSGGNPDVAKMSYILSCQFKYSLKPDIIASLAEEMDIIRMYLELMCLRYLGTLNISYDIDESTYERGIIRHIMQPIIENIMNHGLDTEKKQINVEIRIYRQNNDIIIEVKDDGKGIEPAALQEIIRDLDTPTSSKSTHIGLSNVHQRIHRIFNEPYGIQIESMPGRYTQVTIRFPSMSVKEMNEYVQRLNR